MHMTVPLICRLTVRLIQFNQLTPPQMITNARAAIDAGDRIFGNGTNLIAGTAGAVASVDTAISGWRRS